MTLTASQLPLVINAAASESESAHTIPTTHMVWDTALGLLKSQLSAPSFETWIVPLALVSVSQNQAVLKAESAFNRDWILKHYKAALQNALSVALERRVDLQVVVDEPVKQDSADATAESILALEENSKNAWRPWTPRATKSNLNPRYTFENFVVGQHNRFCHAAALAVAETPAQSYNPFFIYGGSGLGKSHLMQSVGHFTLTHQPELKVCYVTAEQFTNELINAIGAKEMPRFRDKYRRNDILIIDDVQFLEGKDRTQEEVFHTFNALHESGKQLILSSDRSPKDLSRLEDRLKSRFQWGLITDIQPPDFETRLAILRQKAAREHLAGVPDEVLGLIAESHPNNIRELEGALTKVAAYGMLTRTTLDLQTAQQVLGTQIQKANLSANRIVECVAAYYHLRTTDLQSPARAKDISHARHVAIYLVRKLTEASFPKIGDLLGGRKHTTILYAFEKITAELESHPVLRQQIQEIQARLKY